MAKRLSDDDKIKQMFREATEPQCARLLAIAQTICEVRFPATVAERPKRGRPVGVKTKANAPAMEAAS